ncbi:hypothetical protein BS329_20415 [Amycolatopsis coloradensis]|uniref:Uncharacterized protein n=1 Tax=Amycolatopsis coloradensis TaxID=76021 RepID=A0A1R0KQS3_9PSEU|nr:hypothetical protein [Amycolatopsis coloradensis]OLZ49999.1 hypothetical protein BS329_20415 [Amycolatopsis coloradensis]
MEKVAARREAERVRNRTPLAELHPLVRELVEIGSRGEGGFLTEDGRDDERTREIGSQIYRSGGIAAMKAAHQQVAYWVPFKAPHLDRAWGGIGGWQS